MKLLCAGPTSINIKVLKKMGESLTNPDLDPEYEVFHRNMEKKISKLLKTDATSFVMLGEGMLGLEAAVLNLIEEGERALVIYNGIFGEGFADFVKFYGAEPVMYKDDFRRGINLEKLEKFLEKDHDFKIATMVHCETPSGITNDIKGICALLKKYGILTIVDTVSGMGGEEFNFDEFKVDIALGGSQKCLSAPTGLSLITISEDAKEAIKNRKTKVPSFYMNFENYYAYDTSSGFAFPYTMNENLVYALNEALDITLSKDYIGLHKKYANATRDAFTKAGLELYPLDSYSNTVTAVLAPEGHTSGEIFDALKERGIMISKGAGELSNKIFRIGHMGNNISHDNFVELFGELDEVFKELNIKTKASLLEEFKKSLGE
ncbi:pyridoxal-phosphate-dependent aminotransferase family protein [Peptoniphilus sp.]|jgi:aspartate aminotransferase-like enzyme|uniref:pyridoxal-phosphate-dependent aminotransferase family protein n=1 Tax=Peptoniphilus sp. TaxID=1971214 RepID=UPI003D92BA13